MKPLVIYHANCADGFGAAFAAWLKLGNEAEYLPMGYNEKLDPSKVQYEDREVYILDFSFPRETMDKLFAAAKRVIWLDHHKTAFEMWNAEFPSHWEQTEKKWITLDNNKSGAMLAWEFFHPNVEIPILIRHIDDYDRWQFKLNGTKEFNKALWSHAPWSFEQWDGFINDNNGTSFFYTDGEAILRAHDQNVQSVVKNMARKCEINILIEDEDMGEVNEYKPGLAANCPAHLSNDVGTALATQSDTFGLVWCLKNKDLIANCSLRSNGDYDVSTIAKVFGGGGHKNAAGFEVPIETLLGWMK